MKSYVEWLQDRAIDESASQSMTEYETSIDDLMAELDAVLYAGQDTREGRKLWLHFYRQCRKSFKWIIMSCEIYTYNYDNIQDTFTNMTKIYDVLKANTPEKLQRKMCKLANLHDRVVIRLEELDKHLFD